MSFLPFDDRSLRQDFDDFDAANPEVWRLFQRFTFEVIERGFKHFSARGVLSRIRWETPVETKSGDGLKLNDHHSPYYGRKFMLENPSHSGFFRTRKVGGW